MITVGIYLKDFVTSPLGPCPAFVYLLHPDLSAEPILTQYCGLIICGTGTKYVACKYLSVTMSAKQHL